MGSARSKRIAIRLNVGHFASQATETRADRANAFYFTAKQ